MSAPPIITVTSILGLALLCGLAVLLFRASWAALLTVFLGITYLFIAIISFDSGILVNMLYPPLAIVGTFVGVNVYNVTAEQSEKKEITRTFGRYVSPSVVNKILTASEEDELKLGGEEHEITVMFADARSFTSISEELPPEELLRVMNIYLSAIINTVLKYNGLINKFGGDSVMAIWNVPLACSGHELLATRAAISAQRAIGELRSKETTLLKMEFGIGVNTGAAVAGSMGSEKRMEYSVIGDAVNTAARLANAAPGGKVWIGANTFNQVKDYVTAEPLEPLLVKGKCEPVQSYQLVDIEVPQTDSVKSKLMNLYR
jgi:adenylate cyclase